MRILVATFIALLVVSASAETTVSSVADLITAMQSCEDGSTFKLSSDVDFQPYTTGDVVVPSGKSLILDLNGKKLTVPFFVQGKLKVVDTSSGRCGFINGQIDARNGQIEFDLHNVATVFTPVEFNNVASMNSLGADISMKFGCTFGKDTIFQIVHMLVPVGADVEVDMNGFGLLNTYIAVQGRLTITHNLVVDTDLYAGGLRVEDGGEIVYSAIRLMRAQGDPFLPEYQAHPFSEIVELLNAGAEVRVRLLGDISDSFELPEGKSLTIDLYDHTLGGRIEVEGNLKIEDKEYGTGRVNADIVVGKSGRYECTIPKTVSTFVELTSALGSSAGNTLNLKLGSDITGDVVEIPVGANITLDLSGRVLTCDKMKVLGGLTLVDSAGKSGYIMADETYIGRKGFVKIAYGPFRTTLTYLSQGLMLMFK